MSFNHKPLKIDFLLILCFLGFLTLSAQKKTFVIVGKVFTENNQTLANANIINKSNSTGTITDNEGAFFLSIERFPVLVHITHLGREDTKIKITLEDFNKNEGYFEFMLKPKYYSLDEVEIVNTNEEKVFCNTSSETLLDYKVTSDQIIILVRTGNKRSLRFVDKINKTKYEKKLLIKANSIFEDCLGNYHLMTNDSIYQFMNNIYDSSVFFYPAYDLDKFEAVLFPCVGFLNNTYFFKKYEKHNQQIQYWFIDGNDKKTIQNVFDAERFLFAHNLLERKNELIAKYGFFNEMGEVTVGQLHILRKIMRLNWTFQKIGKIPIYSPLFVMNDTIVVFNHVKDTLYFYNSSGTVIQKKFIEYHHNKYWGKKIWIDKATNRVYLKFVKSGLVTLKEINIHNGTIVRAINLSDRLFPENITIYNNHVYYLYTNVGTRSKSLRNRLID